MVRAYAAIGAGTEPWVALNEFFHEWFGYARTQRGALVAEPIRTSVDISEGTLWRWAVFCAGATEYLCDCGAVPCPAWADDPIYTLREPWYGFGDPGASTPEARAYLELTTPWPLRRRNVFSGSRVFANKYERS
jgi:hypothetical protein